MLNYKKRIFIKDIDKNTGVILYDYTYVVDSIDDEVKLLEESLNIINRKPVSGDNMYFLHDVTVPRFKIKEYNKNKGTKIVKYIESANLVIFSSTSLRNYFNHDSVYEFNTEDITRYLKDWIMVNNNQQDERLDNKWANDLIDTMNENRLKPISKYNYNLINFLKEHGITSSNHCIIRYANSDNYSRLQKIANMKCDFIDESIILKEINNSITMDADMFNSIQKLMDSSDKENMKLAMEMMANCNFDASAVYLLLLLKKYNKEISNIPTKKHINFKAMLHYFGYHTNSNFYINTDDIIVKLKNKNIFKKSQQDVLKPMILEECTNEDHYRVSMITFIDEEGNDLVEESAPDDTTLSVQITTSSISFEDVKQVADNIHKYITTEQILQIIEEYPAVANDDIISNWSEIVESMIYNLEGNEEFEDLPELDEIIYYELSEVIKYCKESGLSNYRDQLLEIRALARSPEYLLEIMEFFDKDELNDYFTTLTQCYLDMK